ncbi:DUF4387 family protein [Fodinicurvata sp. EGI_FJ10296]|uniref:DUF4387 family protein n=1 Tax=Fodinicurvata sp. EGI_FJ10296 TaxID=3231908 RepID=UPI003453C830
MPRLKDVATTVRSKNAGAFLATIDVIFKDQTDFERFRNSDLFGAEKLETLLHCEKGAVAVIFYEKANAVKITFPRAASSGSLTDSDIYGAQYHALIMDLPL